MTVNDDEQLSHLQSTIYYSALPVDCHVFGTVIRIHPVLLWDQDGATLVDSGFPGTFAQLKAAVEEKIKSFTAVKRIILTHQDWDHIGNVPDILAAGHGQINVYAHAKEKPYLEGVLPHYKLTPERITARVQALPESFREKAAFTFQHLSKFPVDNSLEDGDIIPFHGGLEVIHTPGHTPGHMCLYLKSHQLLIAGDQLRVVDGELVGPAPEHTPDMPTAQESLKKLRQYQIKSVICYHGGAYTTNPTAKIAELIAK